MDLILWRHAEAEAGGIDKERKLTDKGREQAKKVGAWVRSHVKEYQLVSSPAARARETAAGLSAKMEILDDLYGNAHPAEVLEAVGWPLNEGTVILVGHQPQLGEIASFVMTHKDEPWPIKKGSIWWFKTSEDTGRFATELFTVVPPKLA